MGGAIGVLAVLCGALALLYVRDQQADARREGQRQEAVRNIKQHRDLLADQVQLQREQLLGWAKLYAQDLSAKRAELDDVERELAEIRHENQALAAAAVTAEDTARLVANLESEAEQCSLALADCQTVIAQYDTLQDAYARAGSLSQRIQTKILALLDRSLEQPAADPGGGFPWKEIALTAMGYGLGRLWP